MDLDKLVFWRLQNRNIPHKIACRFVNCFLIFIYYSNFYHILIVSNHADWWVRIIWFLISYIRLNHRRFSNAVVTMDWCSIAVCSDTFWTCPEVRGYQWHVGYSWQRGLGSRSMAELPKGTLLGGHDALYTHISMSSASSSNCSSRQIYGKRQTGLHWILRYFSDSTLRWKQICRKPIFGITTCFYRNIFPSFCVSCEVPHFPINLRFSSWPVFPDRNRYSIYIYIYGKSDSWQNNPVCGKPRQRWHECCNGGKTGEIRNYRSVNTNCNLFGWKNSLSKKL